MEINEALARRVLEIVDVGLSSGLGKPVPGQLCVEAAVNLAMGLPHGDEPTCVSPALRRLKIALNDKNWSSKAARASGLRRLAVAQLGSAGFLDDRKFLKRVAESAIRKQVPVALRAAASIQKDATHKANLLDAALKCEREGTRASAQEARKTAAAASAASAAAASAASAAAYAAASAYAYADASAATAAAYADAAKSEARDKVLSDFAEDVVQILVTMKAPGCQWLPLTELVAA